MKEEKKRPLITVLKPGMFDRWHGDNKGELELIARGFGLTNGQMRSFEHTVAHNGVWFNRAGERIGCGDLNLFDLPTISANLRRDDAFFVLHESDGYGEHGRKDMAPYSWLDPVTGEEQLATNERPGPNWMVTKACWLVLPCMRFYHCDSWKSPAKAEYTVEHMEGISLSVIQIPRGFFFDVAKVDRGFLCRHNHFTRDCWECDREEQEATTEHTDIR